MIWVENTLVKSGQFNLSKKTEVMQEKTLPIFEDVKILVDSGYQSLQKEHKNTILSTKKRNSQLIPQ